jgi:hypothetical protein
MKIIITIGVLVISALIVLLAIYFRKALFVLSIPAMVTLFSAGAVFRHDHRFVWPLIGISVNFKLAICIFLFSVFPLVPNTLLDAHLPILLFLQTALHNHVMIFWGFGENSGFLRSTF